MISIRALDCAKCSVSILIYNLDHPFGLGRLHFADGYAEVQCPVSDHGLNYIRHNVIMYMYCLVLAACYPSHADNHMIIPL